MGKLTKSLLVVLGVAVPVALVRAARRDNPPLKVEPSVDFARYAGTWHEIARLPNWFEKKCTANVTATYTVRPDGRIDVLNECDTASGRKSARGVAKPANARGPNTKLRVSFFRPFYGDYWILALDPDYRWALVGEPRRKYLWVLARDREMDAALFESILSRAREQDYDLSRLIRVEP